MDFPAVQISTDVVVHGLKQKKKRVDKKINLFNKKGGNNKCGKGEM
jgi:hypothetical protein